MGVYRARIPTGEWDTGAHELPKEPQHPRNLSKVPLCLSPHALRYPGRPVVSPLVWAGMFEHMCRCIYGGVVDDPNDPAVPEVLIPQPHGKLGWRKDVIQHLKTDGELGTPMIRWPGGNFVSNYHWWDAVGPLAERKKRTELAWNVIETNMFGTDEFIDWCRATKIEPYLCLNMGTGTLEEALAWVEYCNGTGDTYWANLRRKNTGRDEPHNVRYWGLGNEMWGFWQVGHMDAESYTKEAVRWADALRRFDHGLKLVSCGYSGATEWDHTLLKTLTPYVDYHSIHWYSSVGWQDYPWQTDVPGLRYEKSVFGPSCAEKNIEVCKSLIDLANIELSKERRPCRDVRVCFDEWNVNDRENAPEKQKESRELDYRFYEVLSFVAWCNVFVRQSDACPIACLAQSVNVLSPLRTKRDGLLLLPIYYPLQLFSKYMKNGHVLNFGPHPDVYRGPTHPAFIQQMQINPNYVDTAAIIVRSDPSDPKASIRVSVLNRHPTASWTGGLKVQGFKVEGVEIHEMYHDNLETTNTWEAPDAVKPTVKNLRGDEWDKLADSYEIKKHSWSFFIIDGCVE